MTSNPKIMYSIGVHPHKIFYPNQFSAQNILKHVRNPKCVGVGEIVQLYKKVSLQTPSQYIRTITVYREKNCSSTPLLRQTTFTNTRYWHSYCQSY